MKENLEKSLSNVNRIGKTLSDKSSAESVGLCDFEATLIHHLCDKPNSFLVQSFKETLQHCDEWRKFTSVSHRVIESSSHSVNSGGESHIRLMCETLVRNSLID